MSKQVKEVIVKSVDEAIQSAGYRLVFNLSETKTEYNLDISYASDKTVSMSFDKKNENPKYLAAKMYDVVDFYAVKYNYPLALVEYQQNKNRVKFWKFGEPQDTFLRQYITVVSYGLQREECKTLSNEDLEFVMARVFKRSVKVVDQK